jgi:hypothetical protein
LRILGQANSFLAGGLEPLQRAADAAARLQPPDQELRATAEAVAAATGHPVPADPGRFPTLLDNVIDCTVCHACHQLGDVSRRRLSHYVPVFI